MPHDRLSARSLACGVFGVVRLAAGRVMAGTVNVDTLVEQARTEMSHVARGCRSSVSHNPAVHEQSHAAILSKLAARARERDASRRYDCGGTCTLRCEHEPCVRRPS